MRMVIGDRVKERMQAAGLSQAELARRVGVSQPSIFNLIHRSKKGSTRLHAIARELGTTPAYLNGEVDDPDLGAPPPPVLTPIETDLVDIHRGLDAQSRSALLHVARTMLAGVNAATPSNVAPATKQPTDQEFMLPPEYALIDVFRGLLMSMPDASGDELAHELAKLLPIALARLKGPFRYEASDSLDEGGVSASDQHSAPQGRQRA